MGYYKNLELEREFVEDRFDSPLDEEDEEKVEEADNCLEPYDYLSDEELEELKK